MVDAGIAAAACSARGGEHFIHVLDDVEELVRKAGALLAEYQGVTRAVAGVEVAPGGHRAEEQEPRVARRAGIQQASNETSTSNAAIPTKVSGSVALTPNSRLFIVCVNASAAMMPRPSRP